MTLNYEEIKMLNSKPKYNDDFTREIEAQYLDILEKINQLNSQYKLAQRYSLNIEEKIKEAEPIISCTSFPPELMQLRKQQEEFLKKTRISKDILTEPESVVSLNEAILLLAYIQNNLSELSFSDLKVLFGRIENALKKQVELDNHLNSLLIQTQKKASDAARIKASVARDKAKAQLEAYRHTLKKAITDTWGDWESISHFIEKKHECILRFRPDDPSLALNEDNYENRVRRWLREDPELKESFMSKKRQKIFESIS